MGMRTRSAAGITIGLTTAFTASAHAAVTTSWSGATTGAWTDASRWSGGVVPDINSTISYAARVDAAAAAGTTYSVQLRNATVTIDSLTVAAPGATVELANGALTTSLLRVENGASFVMNGKSEFGPSGTLIGARLETAGTGIISGAKVLWDNVTLTNGVRLGDINGGVAHGLHLAGDARVETTAGSGLNFTSGGLDGSGTIVVADRPNSSAYKTAFTAGYDGGSLIGAAVTIQSAAIATTPAGAIVLGDDSGVNSLPVWFNDGVVACDGDAGQISLTGAWTNRGTLRLTAGHLVLGGAFTTAGIGNFQRSGGTVDITGVLDNRNATLRLDDAKGSWNISTVGSPAKINGGRIETTGTNQLVVIKTGLATTFADVTLAGTAVVNAGATLALAGTHFTLDDGGTAGASVLQMVGTGPNALFTGLNSSSPFTIDGSGEVWFTSGLGTSVTRVSFGPNVRLRALSAGGASFGSSTIEGIASAERTGAQLTFLSSSRLVGTASATGGGSLQIGDSGTPGPTNDGLITTDAQSSLIAYPAIGNGRYELSGTVLPAGRYTAQPTFFAAKIASLNNATLSSSAVLEFDSARPAATILTDSLVLSGTTTLAGTLRIREVSYTPLPGTRMTVVTLANPEQTTGTFAGAEHTLKLLGLHAGVERVGNHYDVVFSATAGDANLDASVNFADLVVLAQHYNKASGQTWLAGDFNGDAAVNFGDLVLLAQNYGRPPAAFAADWGLAQSLVPEPATLVMLPVFAAGALRRRPQA